MSSTCGKRAGTCWPWTSEKIVGRNHSNPGEPSPIGGISGLRGDHPGTGLERFMRHRASPSPDSLPPGAPGGGSRTAFIAASKSMRRLPWAVFDPLQTPVPIGEWPMFVPPGREEKINKAMVETNAHEITGLQCRLTVTLLHVCVARCSHLPRQGPRCPKPCKAGAGQAIVAGAVSPRPQGHVQPPWPLHFERMSLLV